MSVALTIKSEDFNKIFIEEQCPTIEIIIHFNCCLKYIQKNKFLRTKKLKLNSNISLELEIPIKSNITSIEVFINEYEKRTVIDHHYYFNFKENQKFHEKSNSIDIIVNKGIEIPKLLINGYPASAHEKSLYTKYNDCIII